MSRRRHVHYDPTVATVPDLFAGETYEPEHDQARLAGQLDRVATLMRDGVWRTLAEIVAVVGGSEAGVSARLRDLRKKDFGAHFVQRRRRGDPKAGLHEYRLGWNLASTPPCA